MFGVVALRTCIDIWISSNELLFNKDCRCLKCNEAYSSLGCKTALLQRKTNYSATQTGKKDSCYSTVAKLIIGPDFFVSFSLFILGVLFCCVNGELFCHI